MTTVAPSADVRAIALATIARNLGGAPQLNETLEPLGADLVGSILVDLERALAIELDRGLDGTIGDLVDEVAEAVAERADTINRNIVAWDDERARRGLPLYAPRPRQHLSVAFPPPDETPIDAGRSRAPDLQGPAGGQLPGESRGLPPQTRGSHPYPAEPEPFRERAPIVAPIRIGGPPRLVWRAVESLVQLMGG